MHKIHQIYKISDRAMRSFGIQRDANFALSFANRINNLMMLLGGFGVKRDGSDRINPLYDMIFRLGNH